MASKIIVTMDDKRKAGEVFDLVQAFLTEQGVKVESLKLETPNLTKSELFVEYLTDLIAEGRKVEARKDIADTLKISQATISNVLNGVTPISDDEKATVAAFLALEAEHDKYMTTVRGIRPLAANPHITREALQGICDAAGVDIADVLNVSNDESDNGNTQSDVA